MKGINKNILTDAHFVELQSLLVKGSFKDFSQEKWYKDMLAGTISIKDVAYQLRATHNKRRPLFVNDVLFNDTAPYRYLDIENVQLSSEATDTVT